jgi:hypothetical protein
MAARLRKTKKTAGVERLVQQVLPTLPRPYSEDITDDVCYEIEHKWRSDYDALIAQLSVDVVNNWIGRYVLLELGRKSSGQVPAVKSNIIKSYSKLPP